MKQPGSAPAQVGFSRRGFFLFLLLAPASFACVLAIILVLQFKQFRALVAAMPDVEEIPLDSVAALRLRELADSFHAFAIGNPATGTADSLWLTSRDLDLLLAACPVARAQGLRFRVGIGESTLTVRSTQPVSALRGRLAWLFRKMAGGPGYLNASLEGRPKLGAGRLDLDPVRAFMNGQKVPRAALVKRGGMSPGDFLTEKAEYERILAGLKKVKVTRGMMLLARY